VTFNLSRHQYKIIICGLLEFIELQKDIELQIQAEQLLYYLKRRGGDF